MTAPRGVAAGSDVDQRIADDDDEYPVACACRHDWSLHQHSDANGPAGCYAGRCTCRCSPADVLLATLRETRAQLAQSQKEYEEMKHFARTNTR